MKIKWIAFAIVTLLTILTVFMIPRLQRKIPDVPRNNVHIRVTNVGECINCHVITGEVSLPKDHAAREKCLYCHKMKKL